jgi:hypothetical protein
MGPPPPVMVEPHQKGKTAAIQQKGLLTSLVFDCSQRAYLLASYTGLSASLKHEDAMRINEDA